MKSKSVVVLVTASSKSEAVKISKRLLEKKLAACINLVSPVESSYWWKGKMEKSREVLLIIKTRKSLVKKLVSAVRAVHSYTVPEIIALPVVAGSRDYLEWIDENTLRGHNT